MHAKADPSYRPWPEQGGPWQVRLDYVTRADRIECVGLSLKPMVDDCPPLTSTVLGRLRVAQLIAEDSEWRLHKARQRLRTAQRDDRSDQTELANLARGVEAAEGVPQPPKRGRKAIYGHEHYERVAKEYLLRAGDRNPTAQVAELFTVTRSTAASWIREARNRGLLPPTTQGRTQMPRGESK